MTTKPSVSFEFQDLAHMVISQVHTLVNYNAWQITSTQHHQQIYAIYVQ